MMDLKPTKPSKRQANRRTSKHLSAIRQIANPFIHRFVTEERVVLPITPRYRYDDFRAHS